MRIPQSFTVEPGTQSEQEPNKETAQKEVIVEKASSLDSLVIKDVENFVNDLKLINEPSTVDNFDTIAMNYLLTKESIKHVLQVDYQHKEKEEWIDVYLVEYKKGKIEKDFFWFLAKQKDLARRPKQELGTMEFLVKDDYAVLIHAQTKSMEKLAKQLCNHYKTKFGMEGIKINYEPF